MQKILRKRVLRDLKQNLFRYLALGLLIILGMYIVISLVGASETVIIGCTNSDIEHKIEDGEFQTFVPLSNNETQKLKDDGITIEKMFYQDFKFKDSSTVRIFKERKKINLICIEDGKLPIHNNEICLEKRYCEVNNINIGNKVTFANKTYNVCGIVTAPDYDAPFENLSDTTVDSENFGIGFVTDNAYSSLLKSGKSVKAEEFVYSYLLNNSITDNELKDKLKDYEISSSIIKDKDFKKYWETTGGKKEELLDGVKQLSNGGNAIRKALSKIDDNSSDIKNGASQLFSMYLSTATSSLEEYGLKTQLTEDNYIQVLNNFNASTNNSFVKLSVNSLKDTLTQLKNYKDGVAKYTDAVGKTADGSVTLSKNLNELNTGVKEYADKLMDVKLSNLTSFTTKENNPRIAGAPNDQIINKYAGLMAGIILLLLFTYVISVFVIHSIQKESSVIGALYAMGVSRKDLMLHYLTLPVIITFISALIGTAIGLSSLGIPVQLQDCYDYFSIPTLQICCPLYLYLYGLVVPPLIAVIVNYFVIKKHLSQTVLSLIKGETSQKKVRTIKFKKLGFIKSFQINQMLKEMRTGFTVVLGMLIALLIVMLSIDCYLMCSHISQESVTDTKYEYMYTYKYPDATVPNDGEACYAKGMKKEAYGYNLDVTIFGIQKGSSYFDANVKKSENNVVISSAMSQKYNIKKGDNFIVTDEDEDRNYAFTVEDVTQYSTGMYVFMNIDSMRKLFNQDSKYYNVVVSDKKLDIDSGKLYSTTSKDEIVHSSNIFVNQMQSMIIMLIAISILIFAVVMYLMMKVMIERASQNISLLEIFGYRIKELKKLYLNGNLFTIIIGAIICIPLSKKLMDMVYPFMVSNVASGMNLNADWWIYALIFVGILLLYFIINFMLVKKLKKIVPADVLKNRE